MSGAGRIILNSPYSEPERYFLYNESEKRFEIKEGRRPSGFFVERSEKQKVIREFVDIPLVNKIRPLVGEWRESGYPEATVTTKELLAHWHDRTVREDTPFFFCQLEAVETLIYLSETEGGRGILIQDDGSEFRRVCTKLCTGGGKTIVMSMLIAWQVCNAVNYPSLKKRYTRNILIISPNLTVKSRLQVLNPKTEGNYYVKFSVVPESMRDILNQAVIEIHNWHVLEDNSVTDPVKNKSVVKKPPRSDEAYCREIISGMRDILVINDEAHHAWRVKPEDKKAKTQEEKDSRREATVWVEGLDRIHRTRGIMRCYDFTATPFVPGRGRNDSEGLFGWIVSDFSLDDGIESGLVKTPCIVVRDNTPPNSKTERSKLYHIYPEVRDDLNRPSEPDTPLPDLVRSAYELLGHDWEETFRAYQESGSAVPPVMITVANNTNTAARIEESFRRGKIDVPELCREDMILRIDSERLKKEPARRAEELRLMADTVGQEGQPGGQLRNVISVGMLSEGWDARTVTHIMGLRAFSSQLLCEQIVGRGLRRTSYEAVSEGELFEPEYVNVFGIPFSYLLTEEIRSGTVIKRTPSAEVKVLDGRKEYAITWPEVIDVRYRMKQRLRLSLDDIPELVLNASSTRINAELAPVIAGKQNLDALTDIDLEKFYASKRMQEIIFRTAMSVFDQMKAQSESKYSWQNESTKFHLMGEIIRLTQEYISGGNIKIFPERFVTDVRRKKILLCFNMDRVIKNMWQGIRSSSSEEVIPVFPQGRRERSTGEMPTWRTSRPNHATRKSHINLCTFDSTWEASTAYQLDHNSDVQAWAKNDHLGFYVRYFLGGISRRYLPDFLVRLTDGKMLVLEVKGIETEEDRVKHEALCEWVRAVNGVKVYGEWACDVSYNPADIDGIIAEHLQRKKH